MTSAQKRRLRAADAPVETQVPERVRFRDFSFERTPSGQVTCTVALEFGNQLSTGVSTGQASPAGDTRLGADAAIRALEMTLDGAFTFELVGVKVVRAFDANVVITSLFARSQSGTERVMGCVLTDDDIVRAAALSVLNATNRVVGAYIQDR